MTNEYGWQKFYHEAMRETDSTKLERLLWQAKKEIEDRLDNEKLYLDHLEGRAIEQTLDALSALKTQRLEG